MVPEGFEVCLGVPSERDPLPAADPAPSDEELPPLEWEASEGDLGEPNTS